MNGSGWNNLQISDATRRRQEFDERMGCNPESANPQLHDHPLAIVPPSSTRDRWDPSAQWMCDGCGHYDRGSRTLASRLTGSREHWSCTVCDFDYCGECQRKALSTAGETVEVKPEPAVVVDSYQDAIVKDVSFADLRGQDQVIADTALRAIELNQLKRVVQHIRNRLGDSTQGWKVTRFQAGVARSVVATSPDEINLNDLCEHVILAATASRQCSMVEFMAEASEQPPDYFVSHWWGEPVVPFLECLKQHSEDKGLTSHKGYVDGKFYGFSQIEYDHLKEEFGEDSMSMEPHPGFLRHSPRYWICACNSDPNHRSL